MRHRKGREILRERKTRQKKKGNRSRNKKNKEKNSKRKGRKGKKRKTRKRGQEEVEQKQEREKKIETKRKKKRKKKKKLVPLHKKQNNNTTTVCRPTTPPTPSSGQPPFLFLIPPHQLHCSANEQWRVNYNSLSIIHVACKLLRAIVLGSDQRQPRPKCLAGSDPILLEKSMLGRHQPNPSFGPILSQCSFGPTLAQFLLGRSRPNFLLRQSRPSQGGLKPYNWAKLIPLYIYNIIILYYYIMYKTIHLLAQYWPSVFLG